jgi:hypothetical protein
VTDKDFDYQQQKLQEKQYLKALEFIKENYSENLFEFTESLFNPEKNSRYAYF